MTKNTLILAALITFLSSISLKAETSDQFQAQRDEMVKRELIDKGINDQRVIEVMKTLPLDQFVPKGSQVAVYKGQPISIGHGQMNVAPHVIALMIQNAKVSPQDKILDIGTGSGYFAAVLGKLAKDVYTIDIVRPLAKEAKARLKELGYTNVHVKKGDGLLGMEKYAPFDKIFITFSIDQVPQPLIQQLKSGGRLVMLKSGSESEVITYTKTDKGLVEESSAQ